MTNAAGAVTALSAVSLLRDAATSATATRHAPTTAAAVFRANLACAVDTARRWYRERLALARHPLNPLVIDRSNHRATVLSMATRRTTSAFTMVNHAETHRRVSEAFR